MDQEKLATSLKQLKEKAKKARKQGKKEMAQSFSKGMKRAQRRLKAAGPKKQRMRKKKSG